MAKNKKFTGGDNLSGIHKKYHDIMMQNELQGGYKGYELSWAGPGKSAPSFGGNQMDIGGNQHARDTLKDIIKNAVNEKGESFFIKSELDYITTILKDKNSENLVGKSPSQIFGDKVEKINQALSSKYGIETINKAYVDEIANGADTIEKVVKNIKHPAAKAFYDTDLGRTLLFDYNNQYNGISKGGPLENYMNGKEVTMFTGKKLSIADKQEFTLDDHRQFILNLKQANNNDKAYKNTVQRLENIEKYFSAKDKIATLSERPFESVEVKKDIVIDSESCKTIYKIIASLNGRITLPKEDLNYKIKYIDDHFNFQIAAKAFDQELAEKFNICFSKHKLLDIEKAGIEVTRPPIETITPEECTIAMPYTNIIYKKEVNLKDFLNIFKQCKEIMEDKIFEANYLYLSKQSIHDEL
ncbi:hypothetical protein NF27_CG01470 [Candidatus Jidaibacter acanthamoeba]|uniref:Uncharacterized protein n=1 Tax=Candidatus Jidaibacter acanthamoebae TaxID=86105 RepID=A0A0C1MV29_9RICK|nr:hypothetical protein [Candidatus Jidaibacter acanthamoeba]KIE05967.1 hypothetical protein NF27_CG01470 [Candidatus Jidaibacter acanthamoeba]